MQGDKVKGTFLNRRDWSSFLCALHGATGYPKVLDAVKSSRDWFAQGAAHASHWVVGSEPNGKLSTG